MDHNLHLRYSITSAVHGASHMSGHHHTTHNPMVKQKVLWILLNVLYSKQQEGTTTEEILNTFLLSYRTTPNVTVKNEMSPKEALMGRKLQITLDALRPQKNKGKMHLKIKQKHYRSAHQCLRENTGLDNQTGFQVPYKGNKRTVHEVKVGKQFWAWHRK